MKCYGSHYNMELPYMGLKCKVSLIEMALTSKMYFEKKTQKLYWQGGTGKSLFFFYFQGERESKMAHCHIILSFLTKHQTDNLGDHTNPPPHCADMIMRLICLLSDNDEKAWWNDNLVSWSFYSIFLSPSMTLLSPLLRYFSTFFGKIYECK